MALQLESSDTGVYIKIKAVPGSSRSRIAGLLDDALKVNIAAVPEKSKANKELIRFLAKLLNLPKSAVTITAGLHDARKKVHISGITAEKLLQRLKPYL